MFSWLLPQYARTSLDKKIVFPALERAATSSALALGATSDLCKPNRPSFHCSIHSSPAPLWIKNGWHSVSNRNSSKLKPFMVSLHLPELIRTALDKIIVFPTLERAATSSALAFGVTSNPASLTA
jgi:hypothetical protein